MHFVHSSSLKSVGNPQFGGVYCPMAYLKTTGPTCRPQLTLCGFVKSMTQYLRTSMEKLLFYPLLLMFLIPP